MLNRRVYLVLIPALLAVAAAFSQAADDDIFRVECNGKTPPACPSGSNGVMLVAKGAVRTATRNPNQDVVFSSIDPSYTQAMVFRKGYTPAYRNEVVWTSASDVLEVTLEKQFNLPIRIWAICPDANGDCSRPLDEAYLRSFKTNANVVLRSERVGVRLVAAEGELFSDKARTEPGAFDFKNFSAGLCADFYTWVEGGPGTRRLDRAVNIYVVSDVDGLPKRGRECSKTWKTVVVGAKADWTTMLHEVGHALSLGDLPINGVAWDGDDERAKENFMYSDTDLSTRRYFTEAQIFRVHVNDASAAHPLWDPNAVPSRSCGVIDDRAVKAMPPCPILKERVWPEP
jgi:hypothetical protein